MRLPRFARQTVIVRTPGSRLVHGAQVDDWTTAAEQPVAGCLAVPAATDEVTRNRDNSRDGWNVYLPADRITLTGKERLRLANGLEYAIVGDPGEVPAPSGGDSHVFAYVERFTG